MSDNNMTINLLATVFNSKEEEWPELIVKFQAFLARKGCAEVIQTYFKSKLPFMEDEELDAGTKLINKEISKDEECDGNGICHSMFEWHGHSEHDFYHSSQSRLANWKNMSAV